MELSLKGKVILISGGAKDTGAAIAHACGREGGVPVIVDRDISAIQRIRAELHEEGIEHDTIQVELAESSETSRAVEDVGRKFGRIDGLVNDAGVNDGVGLEHGSPERFAASLKRNLVPYYTMTQAALPFLKQSKGSMVIISSTVGVTGQGGTSGYAAAMGAVLGFTLEWAAELSLYGIRINAVVRADMKTPQYEDWVKKFDDQNEELQKIAKRFPLGHRMTELGEIGATTVFLLSSKSAGITGQHLFVRNG